MLLTMAVALPRGLGMDGAEYLVGHIVMVLALAAGLGLFPPAG